jgi:hypothetical protein
MAADLLLHDREPLRLATTTGLFVRDLHSTLGTTVNGDPNGRASAVFSKPGVLRRRQDAVCEDFRCQKY